MLTHSVAARNAAANAKLNLADLGVTNPNGRMIVMTAADLAITTHEMANPAWTAAANGQKSLNTVQDASNGTGSTQTAALYKLVDRDGVEYQRGTVTATGGGGDLELSQVNIGPGTVVQGATGTYTEGA